jgi:hypothetical protein
MEALIQSFLESLMPAAVGGSEAVIGGGAAPMSFGDTLGGFAQNQLGQQMAPTMDFYNTMTNPNTSMGDMAKSAFKYSFNPKEDEKSLMTPQMGSYGGGMASNYVGGIPSLLQNTGSGILPYIGSR